jgi:site-specific recombinase XerD
MPRPKGLPSYRLHKPSGQARAIVNGRHIYLGAYGSPESHERFAQLIAEQVHREPERSPTPPMIPVGASELTINELILAYWNFAKGYYVCGGVPTKEIGGIRDAVRPLRLLFGQTLANEFGPKKLATVRQHMIGTQKLARTEINKRIGRLKRMFKWAASEELVSATVVHGLQTLTGLRYGRSEARETEPVKPVADRDVDLTLPFLAPPVRAMVEAQRLTGMRPCEVVLMRSADIDRSQDIWGYEPRTHKNKWRGHARVILLGPRVQQILLPFLKRNPEDFLFSPKEAEAWRIERQIGNAGLHRKTRVFASELRRREAARRGRKRRVRRRAPGERYETASYGRCIKYAIQRARKSGIELTHWHPNQLRHAKATELRKQHGLEAAQVVLGHARADVTQIYAERNVALAKEIAKQSG